MRLMQGSDEFMEALLPIAAIILLFVLLGAL